MQIWFAWKSWASSQGHQDCVIKLDCKLSRLLDGKFCSGDRAHQPVIGGENITGPTGHYPKRLAKLLADGFEKQFKIEYDKAPKPKDVFSFCS